MLANLNLIKYVVWINALFNQGKVKLIASPQLSNQALSLTYINYMNCYGGFGSVKRLRVIGVEGMTHTDSVSSTW